MRFILGRGLLETTTKGDARSREWLWLERVRMGHVLNSDFENGEQRKGDPVPRAST